MLAVEDVMDLLPVDETASSAHEHGDGYGLL
jgi:hypothetical protein